MNTRLLECFVTVVECGSITQAARQLFTTQPNLSKQIATLERELGIRLFYREHRSIQLTPAGEVFYSQVKSIPQMLDSAARRALETAGRERSCLRVGILEGHQLRPELLTALDTFHKTHPSGGPILSRCDFDALLYGLENHQFDLIFTILFTVEHRPGVRSLVLYPQKTFVAVNTQNPLAAEPELSLQRLAGETVVLLDEKCSQASHRELQATLAGIPRKTVSVNSTEALFTSVEANVGIAIVDGQNRLQTSPAVRLVPLSDSSKSPDFGVAWLQTERKPLTDEFLRLLPQSHPAHERIPV